MEEKKEKGDESHSLPPNINFHESKTGPSHILGEQWTEKRGGSREEAYVISFMGAAQHIVPLSMTQRGRSTLGGSKGANKRGLLSHQRDKRVPAWGPGGERREIPGTNSSSFGSRGLLFILA